MACEELEALRLALMNITGTTDESVRQHAESEIGDALEEGGPIAALADAESLAACRRHLDTALVELESAVAATDESDPEYDYLRGRVIAVRDAASALDRLFDHGEAFLEDLGDSHHALHETFPVDE